MKEARAVNIRYEEYDIYCGRAGRGHDGFYGNPVRIGYPCPVCSETHSTAGATLPCYRTDLARRIATEEGFIDRMMKELPGKRLGCFCVRKDGSGECHAVFLAAFVNSLAGVGGLMGGK